MRSLPSTSLSKSQLAVLTTVIAAPIICRIIGAVSALRACGSAVLRSSRGDGASVQLLTADQRSVSFGRAAYSHVGALLAVCRSEALVCKYSVVGLRSRCLQWLQFIERGGVGDGLHPKPETWDTAITQALRRSPTNPNWTSPSGSANRTPPACRRQGMFPTLQLPFCCKRSDSVFQIWRECNVHPVKKNESLIVFTGR